MPGPSDFERMLNTFKVATGYSNKSNASENKNSGSSSTATANAQSVSSSSSLKENVERLWNISLLRNSFQAALAHDETTKRGTNEASIQKERTHAHLAVCACIVDALPHERIWRRWMSTTTTTNASDAPVITRDTLTSISYSADMYIHAKYPDHIQSSWVRQKIISRSFTPNWNDVRIVEAMLALAKEALLEEKTTHVLFCTESCIPVSSLEDSIRMLLLLNNKDDDTSTKKTSTCFDMSFLSAYNASDSNRFTRFDERSCWSKLTTVIPYAAIWKAIPGWCVLSRKHMQLILDFPHQHLNGKELWPAFENVWAPEEVFFPTALSLLGVLPSKHVVHQKSLVYSKFIPGQAHPTEYDLGKEESLDRIFIGQSTNNASDSIDRYITMRKVKHTIDVSEWERLIRNPTSGSNATPSKRHGDDDDDGNKTVAKRGRFEETGK